MTGVGAGVPKLDGKGAMRSGAGRSIGITVSVPVSLAVVPNEVQVVAEGQMVGAPAGDLPPCSKGNGGRARITLDGHHTALPIKRDEPGKVIAVLDNYSAWIPISAWTAADGGTDEASGKQSSRELS